MTVSYAVLAITNANCNVINIKIDNLNINVGQNMNSLQSVNNVLQSNTQLSDKVDLVKGTQSILCSDTLQKIDTKSNNCSFSYNKNAINELSSLVYNNEIYHFDTKYDYKLLNICKLLKQNDFSKQTATKKDYKYFMNIIKTLDTQKILNVSMLYSIMINNDKYSFDSEKLCRLLLYYNSKKTAEENAALYSYDPDATVFGLFVLNYYIMSKLESPSYNKPLSELKETGRNSAKLQNILEEYNYSSYLDNIYKKNITSHYTDSIRNYINTGDALDDIKDRIDSLDQLHLSAIHPIIWDFVLGNIKEYKKLELLDEFVLLVNEIYKAKNNNYI